MKKAAVVAIMGAVALAGCGSDESREDADDVHDGRVEKSEPNVTAFNNKYPNVEHKCLYARPEPNVVGGADERGVGTGIGLRVIVTTGGRVVVIPDPHCPGYMPEQANTVSVGGNTP